MRYKTIGIQSFPSLSTDSLKGCQDFIQAMVFAYDKGEYPEENQVLQSIWKDINMEITSREERGIDTLTFSSKQTRKVPLLRSPASRKTRFDK